MYLADDNNTAVFPDEHGVFSGLFMIGGTHYEVHGDPAENSGPPLAPTPAAMPPTPPPPPATPVARFAFAQRTPAAAAGAPGARRSTVRPFQR